MRLRSSQFVFLMLLLCSVQIRQEYALQLITDAISGHSDAPAPQREVIRNPGQAFLPSASVVSDRQGSLGLPPQAIAAESVNWAMPHPAFASAAVSSYTGLLRG